jgi:hypothetical protein
VLVTEYGIAFLRGKTDEEIIKALLNICDSRFQEELLNQAKKAGKIHPLYKIPKEFKNNLPHVYEKIMEDYKQQGFFKPFPFGTDLTELEIKIGGQLKKAKKQMDSGLLDKIKFLIKVLKTDASGLDQDLIERMQLKSTGFKNKFYKKLLSVKLN